MKMEIERSLRKAEHLLHQERFGEAQNEIRNYLATSPEDILGLTILAQTHLGMKQDEKADQVADDMLQLDASNPTILYLKGIIQARLGKRKSALDFLANSLQFNPLNVDAYAVKAMVLFDEAKFDDALEAANEGLKIDPQNETCLNQRSRALLKLGRKEEHLEADKQALKSNPMNPETHATAGFSQLEQGNIKKAKEHFRESLKLDPNNDYARGGMSHAIKSTNFYYRLFLKYVFWMQGLTPQVRWAIVIIGYLLIRGLSTFSEQLGVFSPIANGIIILYMVFAISTWIIGPVSNIFLRFHSFGRFLLSETDIKAANLTAVLLGLSLIGAGILFSFGEQVQWHNFGFYLLCSGIALTVIVSSVENATLQQSKRNLKKAGIVFAVACGILIVFSLVLPALALRSFNILVYAFVGFQFYANSQH